MRVITHVPYSQLDEACDQRFPYHPRQPWRHMDSEGLLYGWPADVTISIIDFQGSRFLVHACLIAYAAEVDILLRKLKLYRGITGQSCQAVLVTLENTEEAIKLCKDIAEMHVPPWGSEYC